MTDYTPPTDQIRAVFMMGAYNDEQAHNRGLAFDRWLAEYTRQQREEAWEEAHRCEYIADEYHVKFCGNPYRKATP